MSSNLFNFSILFFFAFVFSSVSAFSNYGVVQFNETCSHSDNCADYKMLCTPDLNNVKRCFCSAMLYAWNEEMKECVIVPSKLKKWLLQVKSNLKDLELDRKESNNIFVAQGLSGVVALSLLSVFGVVCITYGCFFKNVF